MGLLDGLSAGLNAASHAVIGQQQGQMQGNQILQALRMNQIKMDKENAETLLAKSHAHYFDRESGSPRLGDSNYGSALGDAEAGKLRGTIPAKVEEVNALAQPHANAEATKINTTAAPLANADALKIGTTAKPKADAHALDINTTADPLAQAGAKKIAAETPGLVSRAGQEESARVPGKIAASMGSGTIGMRAADHFVKNNKALSDAVVPYAAAKNAFAEARAGNPAALKTAILSYAAVADPKAQLRQGVIKMIEQVDPSVRGNFEMAVDKLASGKLPPRIIDDMEKMVERTHQTHRDLYEQRRAATVGRQPTLNEHIPTTAEVFDVPGIQSVGPNPLHETIDGMIRAGKSDAEIRSAMSRGVH